MYTLTRQADGMKPRHLKAFGELESVKTGPCGRAGWFIEWYFRWCVCWSLVYWLSLFLFELFVSIVWFDDRLFGRVSSLICENRRITMDHYWGGGGYYSQRAGGCRTPEQTLSLTRSHPALRSAECDGDALLTQGKVMLILCDRDAIVVMNDCASNCEKRFFTDLMFP